MAIHVQFSDDTEMTIVAMFGCEQDPDVYPNLGQVELTDKRYADYYKAVPTQFQAGLPAPQ